MKALIVGGRLQGIELCYLARKAGWRTAVIDRDPQAPASSLCDKFICYDLNDDRRGSKSYLPATAAFSAAMARADFVIPATENPAFLTMAARCAEEGGVPFAHDAAAYRVSSSKKASDALFARLGVPAPRPWPNCAFPLTVKPSVASGSAGVRLLENARDFADWRENCSDFTNWICQEYLAGPSYSLEITGRDGVFTCHAVTLLEMDAAYDCKRVQAPVNLPDELDREFRETAKTIAQAIKLTGIMDAEVILHRGKLKVLEIDARFPSQTPAVVYHATGVNLIEELWGCFAPVPDAAATLSFRPRAQRVGEIFLAGAHEISRREGRPPVCPTAHGDMEKFSFSHNDNPSSLSPRKKQAVLYEHLQVAGDSMTVQGEHIMAEAGPLHLSEMFFGADEAITNYQPGRAVWAATLIILGATPEAVRAKRDETIARIRRDCHIKYYDDPAPARCHFERGEKSLGYGKQISRRFTPRNSKGKKLFLEMTETNEGVA